MPPLATSPRDPAIRVQGLRKSYGDKVVLDGIDLSVETGTVFALLGPNGAGKTTIVNILCTLLLPDHGTASVGGHDVLRAPEAVRGTIGVTGQFSAVDELMSGRENLQLVAKLHHLDRATAAATIDRLVQRFDLAEAIDRPASGYSGGMKRRLDLAMTLVGNPAIIFLDEPTTGLDPRSRRDLWATIREQVAQGVTVFLTTQYLEEADALADRIAVLDGGRVVAEGTADDLKRSVPGGHLSLTFASAADLDRARALLPGATGDPATLTLTVPGDTSMPAIRTLIAHFDEAALAPESLTIHRPDLDDVFLALTGKTPVTTEVTR